MSYKFQDTQKQTEIKCRLIPFGQFITLVTLLLAISIISCLISSIYLGTNIVFGSWQLIIIPIIIGASVNLKIYMNETGIYAKNGLHTQSLHGRKFRSWQDLHSVRLRRFTSPSTLLQRISEEKNLGSIKEYKHNSLLSVLGKNWFSQGFLIMDFKSGGNMAFPLAGFSSDSIENFFLTISKYADPLTINPEVIALQKDILTGQTYDTSHSYTRMWELSLNKCFELTNFVPLMGGQKICNNQLEILMLLSCGGLSSVYLARNNKDKKLIVKELAVPQNEKPEMSEKIHDMFRREARILTKLDHPKIVKVIDHFVENRRNYLVLEFIPGLTLRQYVQLHGPLKELLVIDLIMQLVDIIEYLHNFDPPIIHRDLTPDNLVLHEVDNKITLIDFGAAYEYVSTITGTLIGKQCYIPPEQYQGYATVQSDLYALGATIHFLLTGQDPEPLSTSHPKEIRHELSDKIDQIVSKLTCYESKNRPKAANEISRLLLDTQ